MNRRSTSRLVALTAAAGLAVAALSGCATGSGDPEASDGDVTLTWWHNGTGEPLKSFWEEVAAEFEADHPGVTVESRPFQNEDLQRTLIPNALQAARRRRPRPVQVWAEGEISRQVEAGYLKDLSELTDVVESVGGAVNPWQVDGKQYGIPYRFGIEGIWYNTDQFEQAGVTRPRQPSTSSSKRSASSPMRASRRSASARATSWPAAHWWYQFAIKTCSGEALKEAAETELDFSDECFVEAGENLKSWMDEFVGDRAVPGGPHEHPRPERPGSSAGLLVANGRRRWSSWAPGTAAQLAELTRRPAEDPAVPRLVPVPGIPDASR